jgi:hypothetical protein
MNSIEESYAAYTASMQQKDFFPTHYLVEMTRISNLPFEEAGFYKFLAAFNVCLFYVGAERHYLAAEKICIAMQMFEKVPEVEGDAFFKIKGKFIGLDGKNDLLLSKTREGAKKIKEAALKFKNKTALRQLANFAFFGKFGVSENQDLALMYISMSARLGERDAVEEFEWYKENRKKPEVKKRRNQGDPKEAQRRRAC